MEAVLTALITGVVGLLSAVISKVKCHCAWTEDSGLCPEHVRCGFLDAPLSSMETNSVEKIEINGKELCYVKPL